MSEKNKEVNCGYVGPAFPYTTGRNGQKVEGFFAARLRLGLEQTAHMRSTTYPCEQCHNEAGVVMDNETCRYWCFTCAVIALNEGRPLTGVRPVTDYTDLNAAKALAYQRKAEAWQATRR